MKKLISAAAVLAAIGVSSAYAAGDAADIRITGSRNFEGEEITADNPRTITAVGDIPENAEFIAYIAAADEYRIVRTER